MVVGRLQIIWLGWPWPFVHVHWIRSKTIKRYEKKWSERYPRH